MGSRFIVFLLALVAVVAIATGIFLHRKQEQGGAPQAQSEQKPGESPAAAPPSGETPAKPTEVPSFDVVRIEPTGEGVVAGRAAPDWTVRLESAGATVAETKADDEGAWTIILDKPLAGGDQSLTLKAISPDGTRGVTSQAPVKIAVGPSPTAQPEPVVPEENAAPEPRQAPPVRIGKVEYQDTGTDTGKISMSGVGEPNKRVFFFFDDAPLAEVTIGADGSWTVDIDKKLPGGEHSIRADTFDAKTGMASGRASVTLGRAPETTAQGEAAAPSAGAEAPGSVAAAEPYDLSTQPQPVYPEGSPGSEAAVALTAVAAAEPYDLSTQPQPVYPEGGAEAPTAVASAAEGGLASQPQPVYPDGAPDLSASEPAASSAAPEPFDLSSQPQPVIPESAAEAETSAPVVVGQPVDLSSQPQPVVPEATAEPSPAPEATPVLFKSVDYQDKDAASGTVSLSGTGEPGARIFLFFDEDPLGQVIIGDDGTWKFEAEKKVAVGEHNFRADHLDEKTGTVLGRASIGIIRMEPPKEEAKAPEPEAQTAAGAPASESAKAAPQVAATEESKPALSAGNQVQRKRHLPRTYTVRRGDTLWEIAEAYYGGGWHYRAIVKDNRKKIRNPRLIYPKQKFHIPPR